jgi:hypothetical protein
MATVYGVNATKALTPTPANDIAAGQQLANKRVVYDSYEFSSTAAGTDVYVGAELPAGHRVVGMKLNTDALGGSTTISVGDTASAARYLAATDTSSAVNNDSIVIDGMGYVIGTATGDEQLLCHLTGGTATGTLKIAFDLAY